MWRVQDKRYPSGRKFSLVCSEMKTGRKILIDNHHPKNPHFHLDDNEYDYDYKNVGKLLKDFRNLAFEHFGEKI